MSCNAEARARLTSAAAELEDLACTIGTDVLPPQQDPTDEWTLEATLDRPDVPADALQTLARHSLTLRPETPQAGRAVLVASL